MPNPSIITCPLNTWVKVATNVTAGVIWTSRHTTSSYTQTYRVTGAAAPTDDTDAVALPQPGVEISSLSGIDVYIKAKNEAGEVRVDL